jgi:hypothetical protein
MEKHIFIFLIISFFWGKANSQCNHLTLNDLTSIYKVNLEEREDLLIEKGFQFIETRSGQKLFGKCKNILLENDNYRQYVLIGNSTVQYTTESSQAYLSIKTIAKQKFKQKIIDSDMIVYSNGKIIFQFSVENSQGRPLYFIFLTDDF